MTAQTLTPQPRCFLFLLGSARRHGNTEKLASHAALALPSSVQQRWLHLMDFPLPPFADARHDGVFATPDGHERLLLEATLVATDLVVAVPLYWYTIPASAKLYFDYWTAWLRLDDWEFSRRMRGKTLWLISTSSSDDPRHSEPLLAMLRLTADYMGMHWGGELIGCGNRPGEVLANPATVLSAEIFFEWCAHPCSTGMETAA